MTITVKNETKTKISLPNPFGDVAAGSTDSTTLLSVGDLNKEDRDTLRTLQNQGKVTIVESFNAVDRASFDNAKVGDLRQLAYIGQDSASAATVGQVIAVERDSILKDLTCFYSAAPGSGETVTITLTRNGQSLLASAFAVTNASTGTSQTGAILADDLDNDDGTTSSADPDRLTAATNAAFTAADVGSMVLLNNGNANDGWYRIKTYVDTKNVDLETVAGVAASFATATGQRFDKYLSLKAGDILYLKAVVVGAGISIRWCTKLNLQPR